MKIFLVITGLGVGGAETQVTALADSYVEAGHSVTLLSLQGNSQIRPKNQKVTLVELQMTRRPASFVNSFLLARQLIKREAPDVVHGHMIHANFFVRLLRLTVHIPKLICTSHSTYEGGRLRTLFYRLTQHLSDLNTNVSENAVEAAVKSGKVQPGRMLAVYNGIDVRKFSSNKGERGAIRGKLLSDPADLVLLAVGRFVPAKDYPNLFAAFIEVLKERPRTRLWIAGGGPQEAICRELARGLRLEENVTFLGVRNDIPALMSAADVFVLSSAWEGFGLVVAEAMACELPVVATDCGGVREVVGNAGSLVPPGDSSALGIALLRALTMSDHERETLGRAARIRIVNQYSLDASVRRWLQLYQAPTEKQRWVESA